MNERHTTSKTRHFLLHPTELGWSEFVDRYAPILLAWCKKQGMSPDLAEEIAQQTLIKLHGSFDSYDSKRSFRAWLYTISKNAMIDHYRKERPDQRDNLVPTDEMADRAGDFANYLVTRDLLNCAMERVRLRLLGDGAESNPDAWHSFEAIVIQQKSYQEVAAWRMKPSKVAQGVGGKSIEGGGAGQSETPDDEELQQQIDLLYREIHKVRGLLKIEMEKLSDG